MSINVSSLTPTEAKKYWYDYNNGNTNGISEAEYQSILTKFRSYISSWEYDVDENGYSTGDTPEERLDFDADDAGLGFNTQTAQAATGTSVALGASAAVTALGTSLTSVKAAGGMAIMAENTAQSSTGLVTEKLAQASAESAADAAKKAATKDATSLLVTAAIQFATMLWYKTNTPNKDAVAACETAQNELYTEQVNLADQVLTMEEMQEEMEALQEQALETNEEGQNDIAEMEGLYNYYYTKYQNGTATDSEIALMKALGAQMSSTQSTTNEETQSINADIVEIGAGYDTVTANINNTNEFTNYVGEIDQATKAATIAQGTVLALSAASAAYTSFKCISRATTLSASVFGAAAAAMYIAASVLSGTAAVFFGTESLKQFSDYRSTAEDTIDLRESTQELSTQTTEYQEISTAYWEETVELTNEENLFTLTPTYATGGNTNDTVAETGTDTLSAATSTAANPFGVSGSESETSTVSYNPFKKEEA